ncbi:hypothetical protein BC477_19555 [Clavibacter michiganensis subsp. michiganensis]|uniref:Uncharacterized protein n=1 Tax=Clavibacter michiganensis subsp. michiganensis TaxID=33013 RepID=A0A251XGX6_CLAMM|nr:hypothetical protein BC477_19555 [Clavibacter michiganensis subsp. michiganensis]OUE01681.1 hypothetical protein CMMCAS07_15340 [Clavibacter michiganensis subsp. michiganensis]
MRSSWALGAEHGAERRGHPRGSPASSAREPSSGSRRRPRARARPRPAGRRPRARTRRARRSRRPASSRGSSAAAGEAPSASATSRAMCAVMSSSKKPAVVSGVRRTSAHAPSGPKWCASAACTMRASGRRSGSLSTAARRPRRSSPRWRTAPRQGLVRGHVRRPHGRRGAVRRSRPARRWRSRPRRGRRGDGCLSALPRLGRRGRGLGRDGLASAPPEHDPRLPDRTAAITIIIVGDTPGLTATRRCSRGGAPASRPRPPLDARPVERGAPARLDARDSAVRPTPGGSVDLPALLAVPPSP